jgi:hypothetical protein
MEDRELKCMMPGDMDEPARERIRDRAPEEDEAFEDGEDEELEKEEE